MYKEPYAEAFDREQRARDEYLNELSVGVQNILTGRDGTVLISDLHKELLEYWDRTGNNVASLYSPEQIEAAVSSTWAGEFALWMNQLTYIATVTPREERMRERIGRLDAPLASKNKSRQMQKDKYYAHYRAVADQIRRENPDLGAVRGAVTKLAEKVREKLGNDPRPPGLDRLDSPPSVKTIIRALK
jgi:hypothetical protein